MVWQAQIIPHCNSSSVFPNVAHGSSETFIHQVSLNAQSPFLPCWSPSSFPECSLAIFVAAQPAQACTQSIAQRTKDTKWWTHNALSILGPNVKTSSFTRRHRCYTPSLPRIHLFSSFSRCNKKLNVARCFWCVLVAIYLALERVHSDCAWVIGMTSPLWARSEQAPQSGDVCRCVPFAIFMDPGSYWSCPPISLLQCGQLYIVALVTLSAA